MTRRATGPDGREWVVRSFRFRRPPWRSFGGDVPEMTFIDLVLYLPLGFLRVVVLPLLAFLVEAPVSAFLSLVSSARYVEAVHEGPAPSRMTWLAPSERVPEIVDQIARQLELGYDRITPYNAEFLGFG